MELTTTIISSVATIIVAFMSSVAYVKSNREEKKVKEKAKLDEAKTKLAYQVIAYYCLEQEYLSVLSNEKKAPAKNVQEEMRQRAVEHSKNINHIYPQMTPSDARKYLN